MPQDVQKVQFHPKPEAPRPARPEPKAERKVEAAQAAKPAPQPKLGRKLDIKG